MLYEEIAAIVSIDNHCHLPLHQKPPTTVQGLARHFTEADDPKVLAEQTPHSLFFRRAIRDLATLLGIEADESAVTPAEFAQTVLASRATYADQDWFKLTVEKANVSVILADTGYPRTGGWTVGEANQILTTLQPPVQVKEVLRLERVLEDLILTSASFEICEEAFRQTIREARSKGIVGFKSIIAYRTGLRVQATQSQSDASSVFKRLKVETEEKGDYVRVADKALLDYLLVVALEEAAKEELPVQFHTGFGDTDVSLEEANPVLLKPLLENRKLRNAPVIFLHCYPYLKEASYLASVYPHVYFDTSLTSPLVAFGGGRAWEDALGLAPSTKVMFGSDAWGIPDIIYLGSLHTRLALSKLLINWIKDGWMGQREALEIANNVLHDNAQRLYGLL